MEMVYISGWKQYIGLMFKRRVEMEGKTYVFKLKEPKAFVDIHTFFVRYPLKIDFLHHGRVVETITMKPFRIHICPVVCDEIRETLK